jgi:cation diffusion facilitator CzcD-associated flavoprotein CzcO
MNSVVDTYGVRDQFKVSHEVTAAHWDDDAREWVVKIKSLDSGEEFEDRCDFLVNGCGILNKWKWPDIPGIETFKGKLMHTASWDQEYDFKGKTIATIGVGSSAVQTIPQLVPVVEKMTCFIRSGAWITAGGIGEKFTGPGAPNKPYSDEQKVRTKSLEQTFITGVLTVLRKPSPRTPKSSCATASRSKTRSTSATRCTSRTRISRRWRSSSRLSRWRRNWPRSPS